MFISTENLESAFALECDLCIIGAGAAGITVANELVGSGINVVLIEGGGRNFSEQSQSIYQGTTTGHSYEDLEVSRLRFFGGSTNHWAGSCRLLDDIDFEVRDWLPNSGWPIRKKDIEQYYKKSSKYIDVKYEYFDGSFLKKIRKLKGKLIEDPAVVSRVNLSSSPTNFGLKYRAALENSSNVRVLENLNIVDIIEGSDGQNIESISVKSFFQKKGSVRAKIFVLALGGIENARILLNSNQRSSRGVGNEFDVVGRYFMDHPLFEGIVVFPNKKDNLFPYGGLTLNQESFSLTLELSQKILKEHQLFNLRASFTEVSNFYLSEGISTLQYLRWAYENDIDISNLSQNLGALVSDWKMVLEAILRKTAKTSIFDHSDKFGGYLLDCMFEFPPEKGNRITLKNETDELGLRRVNLHWKFSSEYMEKVYSAMRRISLVIASAGIGRVRNVFELADWERVENELTGYGDHHMGTTRMGNDRRNSVVDKNLKIHGKENMYVLGSSVFPTGGHVTPTTTIVALSIRASDHFKVLLS